MSLDFSYDDVVIGSSPLMLIQALWLRHRGHNVLVVDRTPNLGGSWAIAPVLCDSESQSNKAWNSVLTEVACHLIEPFPRVYKVIEHFSKCPFVPLDVQPIRISPDGRQFPYSSRLILIASGFRLFFGYLSFSFLLLFGQKSVLDSYLNFKNKFIKFLRYQLPIVVSDIRVWAPRDGFAHLLSTLEAQCLSAGIDFRVVEVTNLCRTRSSWLVSSDSSSCDFTARNIHITSSTNLRRTTSGDFKAKSPRFSTKVGWVVEISSENIRIPQSYVAFWKDPSIARISRIISSVENPIGTAGCFQYLLETRFPLHTDSRDVSVVDLFQSYLEQSHIILPGSPFVLIGRVMCKYVANLDQLPAGNIAPNIWSYSSSGNLAAGIAAWVSQSDFIVQL